MFLAQEDKECNRIVLGLCGMVTMPRGTYEGLLGFQGIIREAPMGIEAPL